MDENINSNHQIRPDKIEYYLDIAETVSERSTCLSKNWGSIIVKNDEIISTGYNGSPRGTTNCLDKGYCNRKKVNNQNAYTRGIGYENCLAVHSEMNSIISASRNEMIGSDLFLVGIDKKTDDYVKDPSPCKLCRRMIINAGIKRVITRLNKKDYKITNVDDWTEEDLLGGY